MHEISGISNIKYQEFPISEVTLSINNGWIAAELVLIVAAAKTSDDCYKAYTNKHTFSSE